jgi:hypothetical protein
MKIGAAYLLGLLFIALKLTGYVGWSWLWVLAPFWLSAALGIIFLAFLLGFLVVVALHE